LEAYGKGHDGLLFNLKDEPRQSNNLYAEHPEKVESMRTLLKRYIVASAARQRANNDLGRLCGCGFVTV